MSTRKSRAERSRVIHACRNCGEPGPHYVPPSMGDRGFYLCTPLTTTAAPTTESKEDA